MSIRMGYVGGVFAVFILSLLMLPLMEKKTNLRVLAFVVSVSFWLFIGYSSGEWLYG